MNEIIEFSNRWSTLIVERAGGFLWQSLLLVTVVALAGLCLRKAPPAWRFWLWQLVALKLLILPFWTLEVATPAWLEADATQELSLPVTAQVMSHDASADVPFPDPTPALVMQQPAPTEVPSVQAAAAVSWHAGLVCLWLAGVLVQVFRLVLQRRRLAQLLSHAQTCNASRSKLINELVSSGAARLGLRHVPEVLTVEEDVSPFVCGLLRPRLVLPQSLLNTADPTAMQHVVLHELGHVRRWDLLWCWTPCVLQIVYWFYPVAHWVAHRIQLERELACDQLAIRHSGSSAGEYANTLVDVVSLASSRLAAQAAFSSQFVGGSK